MIDYGTYVEHVRREGRRILAVVDGALSSEVPSCPGWSVRDLVSHLAHVYEHKIACTELGHAPDPWPPAWEEDRDPVDWLEDVHGRLLAMFEQSEPTRPSATWGSKDQTVGFWARRLAMETSVHRIDAELATGRPSEVDAQLAVDGVDEILRVMLSGDWSDEPDDALTGQRVAITTGDRGWRVELARTSVTITEGGDGPSDAGLGGDPDAVFLWLWGRAPDDRVARSGDEEAIRLLRARLVQATQ